MPKTDLREAAQRFATAARELVRVLGEETRHLVRDAAGRASAWAGDRKEAVLRVERDLLRRARGRKPARRTRRPGARAAARPTAARRGRAPARASATTRRRAKTRSAQRGRRAASR